MVVPGARFAPFAPRNSHSQLRHDIHFGAMYEFSVPQPIALFVYGLPRCGAEARDNAATRIANMALAVRGSQKLTEITRAESQHTVNARPGEEKKYRQKCAALCRARQALHRLFRRGPLRWQPLAWAKRTARQTGRCGPRETSLVGPRPLGPPGPTPPVFLPRRRK